MPKSKSSTNNLNRRFTPFHSDIIALESRGYSLGRKIGKGTYATVTLAQYIDNKGQHIKLACKIIDKTKTAKDFLQKFFPRELDIITKLDHPNIIHIHSILQRGPKVFIFMKYAENGDLLDYIKLHGPIGELKCKEFFLQILSGISYLHSMNITHRDLKCENILLSKKMHVKLADFGFAKFCSNSEILSETYCGSAAYAAPEVVSGTPYDPKIADIWSLGVILFIMLNSSMPFDDGNLFKLLVDQKNRNFNFRTRIANTISDDCKNLIHHLLDPDTSKRYTIDQIENCSWLKNDSESKFE